MEATRHTLGLHGRFELELIDEHGITKDYRNLSNLITNAGFDLAADLLAKSSQPKELTHLAIGTGSGAAAAANTSLGAETARIAATYAHTTGAKTFTLKGTIAAGTGTGSIREVGAFNASSGGTCFSRRVFAAVTKGANDSLSITYTLTLS